MKSKKSFGIICLRLQNNLDPFVKSKSNSLQCYNNTIPQKKYSDNPYKIFYSKKISTFPENIQSLLSQFQIQYLVVQRKNTYEYIQILCGKYNLHNKSHLQFLYDQLTYQECDNLLNKSFKDCWKELWLFNNDAQMLQDKYYPDFLKAQSLFNQYDARSFIYPLNRLFVRQDNSWSFPKGHQNKSDYNTFITALREFSEETQISIFDISLLTNNSKFISIDNTSNLSNLNPQQLYKISIEYLGSDSLLYSIDYYVALLNKNKKFLHQPFSSSSNFIQIQNEVTLKEISQIQWVNYNHLFNILQIQQKQQLYSIIQQLQLFLLNIFFNIFL